MTPVRDLVPLQADCSQQLLHRFQEERRGHPIEDTVPTLYH
jgi:RNase adaptor protein for sRNA GlmZ degradation